ncbi:alpha/beta fold hydrolase [uncultured Croceitalea sp.]|uniref:alpha/beta hydrolase n=1 Tax=uncultured Croceitalea sp. TaxID=1798908 RepID=UPI0033058708
MRKFKRLGLVLFLFYLLLVSMLYLLQEKFLFLPSELPQDYSYQFTEPFEEFNLTAKDGALLNAIHFKREGAKGVILYFHGNAGDLSRWGEIATYFAQLQYDVIIMDYRTYGKSTGKLSEQNLFEDAQMFYDHTLRYYSENEIIVYGRSLGTAIATRLSSQNKPSKLILETPFYNLYDVAKSRFPFLPLKVLLKYKFESNEHIKKVTCPITIFHGTDDSIVPYESGKSLFAEITSKKKFITIDGGEHNNLSDFSTYQKAIGEVLLIK